MSENNLEISEANTGVNISEIEESMIYREINNETHLSLEENGKYRIGTGYCHPLFRIENFVKKVFMSKDGPVRISDEKKKGISFELTQLGMECIQLTGLPIEQYDDRFDYSEYVNVFYEAFFSMGLTCGIFDKGSPLEQFEKRRTLTQLFESIREKISEKKFKQRLRNRENNCEKNRKSLRSYALKLLDKHARMLVLRIDLGYKKSISDDVSDWAAHQHLQRFLNNMRSNSMFEHMLGYIWKLEYGQGKGHHFHFAFFFDGARVHKDAHLARKIGEYWVEKIMKGEGVYYNCNMHKNKYKSAGIGMLKYHEKDKVQALLCSLDYLAKKEQYLRIRTKKGCRVLGRKIISNRNPGKGGRPREKDCRLDALTPNSN